MTSRPAAPAPTFDDLRAAFERQRSAAAELRTLAGRQRGFIDREDHRALMHLLERRRVLVEAFAAEHVRLAEWDLNAWRAGAPKNEIDVIDELARNIDEAMQAVLAADEADEAEMKSRSDAARRELGGVTRQRQANQAYARTGAADPRLQDRG